MVWFLGSITEYQPKTGAFTLGKMVRVIAQTDTELFERLSEILSGHKAAKGESPIYNDLVKQYKGDESLGGKAFDAFVEGFEE